jgi:hypothetical protein
MWASSGLMQWLGEPRRNSVQCDHRGWNYACQEQQVVAYSRYAALHWVQRLLEMKLLLFLLQMGINPISLHCYRMVPFLSTRPQNNGESLTKKLLLLSRNPAAPRLEIGYKETSFESLRHFETS